MFHQSESQRKLEIRDTLFGDLPISQWIGLRNTEPVSEPWESFRQAKQTLDAGDTRAAVELFKRIVTTPNLESRHYLEAWQFLRNLGELPMGEEGNRLLGVVVEVGMANGLDLVAAYTDHHARYYNHSGAGVVWERPTAQLDSTIDRLLQAGAMTLAAIGPWKDRRPPAPPIGHARINLLSPNGLHFGQGPMEQLAKDRLGGPVISAAFQLMQELIKLTKKP